MGSNMKKMVFGVVMVGCLTVALAAREPVAQAKDEYGKCSGESDCHPGVKCKGGLCADGFGAKCDWDSDCGAAKCKNGKCATAPDGACSFDNDCGNGGKCCMNKCKW